MRQTYSRILSLGVLPSMAANEKSRLRIINFLELNIQLLFLFYLVVGLSMQSWFIVGISAGFVLTGLLGLVLQANQRYDGARTVFLLPPSFLLLAVCNSINAPELFIVFYFVIFISYALYYDLEKDLRKAIRNLAITVLCAMAAHSLPAHLLWTVQLEGDWYRFLKTVNYPVCFFAAIFYIIQIVLHINRSARLLINAAEEAETQRFEMLQAKVKAEAMALAQTRFVSNMSHELRTPLNGIIGTVQLLLQEPRLPTQQHHFDVLKFSSEHMLSLVNDVLDFSKIEAGKMELSKETFNLRSTIEKIKTIFEGQFVGKPVAFEVVTSPQINRYFQADETRLNQVLNNLLSNAMKFTYKGRVCLEVTLLEADSETANIRFAVSDTGIGIEPEQQKQIFGAFNQGEGTTRKFGGTGLGLTISRKLVSMMGGELLLESQPGKGTSFHFVLRLPVSQESKAFVNENKVGRLQSLQGVRVLVAEDSPVNMVITRKFLQRWDVEITEAQNGRLAVEQFDSQPFDLLLIDLDMPVMDGYEAIAEIRKRDPLVPAVAFTAAVFPNMRQHLQDKGFTDFLQKPFRPEDLHKKLSLYGAARMRREMMQG